MDRVGCSGRERVFFRRKRTDTKMSNATENIVLVNLITEMKKLESVSKKLREENVDLSTARTLFDGILSDFADKNLTHYLGNDGVCVLLIRKRNSCCHRMQNSVDRERK